MIEILSIILLAYFLIGILYASWVFLFGYDRWYWFPINAVLGIPVILMHVYFVVNKKKNPLARY